MDKTAGSTIELPAPAHMASGVPEGDFATGEHAAPGPAEAARHEGDFAAGERLVSEAAGGNAEAELHGDFASGERTEPIASEQGGEGTFADTAPTT